MSKPGPNEPAVQGVNWPIGDAWGAAGHNGALARRKIQEQRMAKMEAALREIQQLVKDYQKAGLVLVDIRRKCREALGGNNEPR